MRLISLIFISLATRGILIDRNPKTKPLEAECNHNRIGCAYGDLHDDQDIRDSSSPSRYRQRGEIKVAGGEREMDESSVPPPKPREENNTGERAGPRGTTSRVYVYTGSGNSLN